jgi:hypothetical protein
VWFDQSELVGGDAWDQKIRRQIKECALFVPVISASTQAPPEGYFRLEWRRADQRTHLMGSGRHSCRQWWSTTRATLKPEDTGANHGADHQGGGWFRQPAAPTP